MPAPKPNSPEPSSPGPDPQQGPGPQAARRKLGTWLLRGLAVLLVVAVGASVAAYVFVGRYDFGHWAAGWASSHLGRTLAIDSLRVTPGAWLEVEMRGARLDNLPGGTRPVMAEVAQVSAEVQAVSLLRGPAVVRKLTINGASVLLERMADRTGNWVFGSPGKPRENADRSRFPLLLDARLNGSELDVRTSSGKMLSIRFDEAAMQTQGLDQPVSLTADGAYNAVPIRLQSELQPIAVLRDASVPYGTKLHFSSGTTKLDFDGTMMLPLDADGAKGRLTLDAPTLSALLAIAGTAPGLEFPLHLAGAFERQGDLWTLAEASGSLADSRVTGGSLQLTEGGGGKPDAIVARLVFDMLDINALSGKQGGKLEDVSLAVDKAPDPLLDVKLEAGEVLFGTLRADKLILQAALTPGKLEVEELALVSYGARLKASGRVEAMERGGQIAAELDVAGMDIQQLRRLLGVGSVPVLGPVTAKAMVTAAGATLKAAERTARASAVVSMEGGSIAREVIEMASTDIRLLFRTPRGMTPIVCLLAAMDMRGGVGTVTPLRVRSAEGAIAGYARFDLNRRTLDMTIGSESATTGPLALDIPVRVTGSFANPSVSPAKWSSGGRAELAAADTMVNLPPAMQQVARRNRCYGRR